ncbi:MAG: DUF2199 domain-containing protein [Thermoanaerobaculia bacterium]|jgi:hypothetical protein
MESFRCSTCGKQHSGAPLSYIAREPYPYLLIPEAERAARSLIDTDLCVIDEARYFMLGNLELKVLETGGRFSWDVWVELQKADFTHAVKVWETVGREASRPYQAVLATPLSIYPPTVGLVCSVFTRPVGARPGITLHESDHPLYREQSDGITLHRVQEIAALVLGKRAGV